MAQQHTCKNHMRYWGTVTSKMVCVSQTIVVNCCCYVKGEMIIRQTNAMQLSSIMKLKKDTQSSIGFRLCFRYAVVLVALVQ